MGKFVDKTSQKNLKDNKQVTQNRSFRLYRETNNTNCTINVKGMNWGVVKG